MVLGGWWWSEVKVECALAAQQEHAPAAQQERAPTASAWLSVFFLESYSLGDCCWVVLVREEVMEWLWPTGKSGES